MPAGPGAPADGSPVRGPGANSSLCGSRSGVVKLRWSAKRPHAPRSVSAVGDGTAAPAASRLTAATGVLADLYDQIGEM